MNNAYMRLKGDTMNSSSDAAGAPGWRGDHHSRGAQGRSATVIAGDGQVSLGQTVVKGNARKVRRLATGGHDRHRRFRRGHGGRLHAVRTASRAKLESLPGPAHPRRGRARQGLAHRPLPPPARSDAAGRRQATPCLTLTGGRRRAGARAWRRGHRFGGQLRPRRRARLADDGDLSAEEIARRAMAKSPPKSASTPMTTFWSWRRSPCMT